MDHPTDNPTAELIVTRIPAKQLVSPEDIAAAVGARSTNPVLRAIATGGLAACRVGGRYVIARAEAERWVRAAAVVPDEAE